jgi:hypothetical protein
MTAFPEKVAIDIVATLALGAAVGSIFWVLAKLQETDHRKRPHAFPDGSAAIEKAGSKESDHPTKESPRGV